MLGNLLELKEFDYVVVDDVTREIPLPTSKASHRWGVRTSKSFTDDVRSTYKIPDKGLERILDVPLYSVDPIVRRANSLQATHDSFLTAAYVHPQNLVDLGLEPGRIVTVRGSDGTAQLPVESDDRVLEGCVYIPAGRPETVELGYSESVWLDVHA